MVDSVRFFSTPPINFIYSGWRRIIVIILGIHYKSQSELLYIIHTYHRLSLLPCSNQAWNQNSQKQTNDADDYEQFNKGKTFVVSTPFEFTYLLVK